MDQSIIDTVSIEDAHRYNDLTLLEKFSETKIILGLIKVASSIQESVEEIQTRVQESLQHIDAHRLIAAPDCGLGHLPRELAKRKLQTMVEAVKKF